MNKSKLSLLKLLTQDGYHINRKLSSIDNIVYVHKYIPRLPKVSVPRFKWDNNIFRRALVSMH